MNLRAPFLQWLCRLTLAFFFLWAASSKILAPQAFARDIQAYQLFPRLLILWISLLLGSFILLLSLTWLRGLQITCGCFGGGQESVPEALLRDIILLLPLLILWLKPGQKRPEGSGTL